MSRKRTIERRRFLAEDDDGDAITVVELQDQIESRAMGRPPEWLDGLRSYRAVETYHHLNVIDQDPLILQDIHTSKTYVEAVTI